VTSISNHISAGDTAWMFAATGLVLMMTPALGLFYAGLVRSKNSLNTYMMSVGALGVVTIAWAVIGYSLAFSKGGGFIGGTAHGWQSDNNDDALRARGFLYRNFVQHVQDFNFNMGGPIVRDKLWFFGTARHVSVDEGVANTYYKVPYETFKVGDPAIQGQFVRDVLARLTYQVTPKAKLSAYMERIWKHKDPELAPNVDPVTASDIRDWRHALYYVGQIKFTSTLTNRILYEAGYSTNLERLSQRYQPAIEEIAQHPFTPEWFSQVTHNNQTTTNVDGAAPGGSTGTYPDRKVLSTAVSYVTGSHAFKTGAQWSFGVDGNSQIRTGDIIQNYILNAAGVEIANSVTVYNTPTRYFEYVNGDVGGYAQDVWKMKRLTLSPGFRFDHFNAEIQAGCRAAGRFVGAFCRDRIPDMPNWNNVSPRFSAVYDLFGDSKTAVKGSVSKYMLPWAGGWAKRYDPFTTVNETRNWTDLNRDNIAEDNEIGPSGNANFGVSTGRAPASGLSREYNVETTVGVQHQLLPRLSVFGGYYHRHFYNQEAQQNPLLTLSDWNPFQVVNPIGNGETMTLFNLNAAKAGLYSKQLVDINSSINRTIYDGFDVSFNARLLRGAQVVGGWSNDRLITISCDQYDPNKLRFCDQTGETFQQFGATSTPPFRNDFKLSANYPLPWDVDISGVFISFAGKGNSYTAQDPSLGVYWTVPASAFPNGQRTRAVVSAPILLAAGGQTQAPGFNLVAPNTKFEPRWNQLDLSVKRTFRFSRKEVQGQLAVFNVLNANTVLQEVQSFGSSLGQPQNVLQGRLMRLAVLINF